MHYLILSGLAFALSLILTPLVRKLAFRLGCVDIPRPPRNLHSRPTAKLGGLAVFLSFGISVALYLIYGDINYAVIPFKFFLAMLAGGALLMVEGYLDDRYNLPPKVLWLFPAISALIMVSAGVGVGITEIGNPFGDAISLKFLIIGIPASAVFVWLWMMGMMFTTKFLDGIDGLVSGIGTIASLTLFALSLLPHINQPMTAAISIILAASLAGYLVYAFHPASIFLGDGGSLLVGFLLGVLSIILGGKIATALLVMGIPILDVAWVLLQRLWQRRSVFRGDRLHLHFRFLDRGFSQRQTVLILYGVSVLFGLIAIFSQTFGKAIALLALIIIMILLITAVSRKSSSKVNT